MPRSCVALFAESAALALKSGYEQPIIPTITIRDALKSKVSYVAVEDFRTEYKDEFKAGKDDFLLDLFRKEWNSFPQSCEDVEKFVQEKMKDASAKDVLKQLEDLGVLERRPANKRRDKEHYQIPDIYLFGLGLTRSG